MALPASFSPTVPAYSGPTGQEAQGAKLAFNNKVHSHPPKQTPGDKIFKHPDKELVPYVGNFTWERETREWTWDRFDQVIDRLNKKLVTK